MEKDLELIRLLVKLTKEGKLAWESSYNDNAFRVNFANTTVVISEEKDSYFISLLNNVGAVVDTFSAPRLMDADPLGENWYSILRELFTDARRKALGADQVLDRILQELKRF